MLWAVAMGLGGGLVMVLFFSVWPRVFGRRHLGRIQGAAQALTVVASAVGPLLLAWCIEWTGSYFALFNILAGVIALTAVAALLTPLPDQSRHDIRVDFVRPRIFLHIMLEWQGEGEPPKPGHYRTNYASGAGTS